MLAAIASLLGNMITGSRKQQQPDSIQSKPFTPINPQMSTSNYGDMIKQALMQKQSGQMGY